MARRSQCSSAGDNPLDPNYLPPHYREEYRLAIDALVEEDLEGYYKFLQKDDVVDFLCTPEIQYIQSSLQVPQQSHHPEQHFLETGGDGSSDTYWPIHSDLDVPGLDLGWPQLHPFIGPTEVTTLVNPPEPDMPSIKEQARRLIKNAQQVIAVVMDMFTDVDILADILSAAMRNVAVYILLDEQNAHHFVNMVSNCRVNLQSIQFLRVRTVSGITYHCRSGKSFKGQMMDRFLLTDCRAVLSGNFSFMWSFEKLHRCMAHLFLGQLVATFDEEFRILFAQSQPLMIENVPTPMEEFSLLQKRQYPSERTSLYRDPRKFLSLETVHPDDRVRHSCDERMDVDWRMIPLKRQGSLHGPSDMYRFPSQQSHMDPPFDQGSPRKPMMENAAFKRHSYAEGVHGRFSYPFLQQQGMPEPENQGRKFHRGQQPYPGSGPGPEADYSGYDKFWNQDHHSADQYSESGLPQERQPSDNFDPVLNYLSSTRNVDFDQGSEKLPAADLPFSSSHPRRLSLGQPYACQTSPTASNPTDQKQFFPEPNTDRKDPTVKRGLRNWRISSYLSAYDNPGDEGLPLMPTQAPDPFEEPSNPIQQIAPGTDVSFPKIPNVREFKVPAMPRASHLPNYMKTTVREQSKKLPDEPTAVAAESKTTPTPSESSSTAEGEKTEEAEQKETKTTGLRREESFRRKYNAAVPRSSRLRSSLIFSSLEQQHAQDTKTAPGQQDEESDTNEAEQTKLPFVSQVLGKRRPAREPFEWSRYIKSATETSKPDNETSKADDKDTSKEENSKDPDTQKTDSSPSMPQSKPSENKTDQPVQPHKSLLTTPLNIDMNDPDKRLLFFKELAAKRKAAKAAEAEKSKDKAPMKPPSELKTNTTTLSSNVTPKDSSSTPSYSILSPNSDETEAPESVSSSPCESLQTTDKTSTVSTESKQAHPDPVSQSMLSENPSAVVSAHTNSEKSCAPTPLEKCVPEPENDSVLKAVAEESEVRSSKDIKADSTPPSLSPSSPKSGLPNVSDLGSSPIVSQSITNASPQDALTHTATPSELNLTGSVAPAPVETECSSPLTDSVGSVLSPGDTEATNKINKSTTQESVKSEKTNDQVRQNNCSEPAEITTEEVVPLSPHSKQPKSRYHSSTANVLSSSNLRDDTKLLLEQISANSQKDEADKNAKREKERGIRTLSRGQPKSSQERDKLLEKIQSMRKERKVYSRFEV
uniref:Protein FAM83H-like n=1 Tax=Seriola lalandi dorsalis TaxID=1841481 RepID=A0A3B4Z5K1_SERLL